MRLDTPDTGGSSDGIKIGYKILLALLIIIPSFLIAGLLYLYSFQPRYSGQLTLAGLQEKVTVLFDRYGIPHIYARNQEDAYQALGYVHASERLFQMEIMRRAAAGRLAEILGEKLVKTDKFFRTLGIARQAEKNAARFFHDPSGPFQKAALAYLAGVNEFIAKGKTPLEFRLLAIPKEKFTPTDIYLNGALMAFGFAAGFQMDPLTTRIYHQFGWKYLKDLVLGWPPDAKKIPVRQPDSAIAARQLAATINGVVASLPVPLWIGSNGWVVSGEKTQSGKVLFVNDTHMMYSQPSVWYEAHLECPGFSFYGNHAAGIPFALIGHSRFAAWGLTMFENDDVDFYTERANPDNPNQVWVDDHWEDLKIRPETIKVKGGDDVDFEVRISRHGPIISDIDEALARTADAPVAVWWSFYEFPTTTIHAFYHLAHAQNIDDARRAAAMINVPGLNVMYGDLNGNIAWWAAAKLVRRPAHVNSKLFLDGASGRDEPLGFYDFDENPQIENPPWGYVYSANNQPDTFSGRLYPGYYVPDDRARRIVGYLQAGQNWSVEAMQKMDTDCISPVKPEITAEILTVLQKSPVLVQTANHRKASQILSNWTGDHQLKDVAPTIYYMLLACILENTFADELGADDFKAIVSSHLMKRTVPVLIKNDGSLWWDDTRTRDIRETRRQIFAKSFDQAIKNLEMQLGADIAFWHWGKVHTLEHGHLLGRQKPLDKIFNVGPFPAAGGNETIVNLGFELNTRGEYPVSFGPAMRIILDFAKPENSLSVNPTGQSGNLFSPHYRDQAALFNSGKFRRQLMDRGQILTSRTAELILLPE